MNISKEDYLKYYSDAGVIDRFKEHGVSGLNSADAADAAAYANGFATWGNRAATVLGKSFSKIPAAGVAISYWGEGARGQQQLDRMAYWFANRNINELKRDPTYRDAIKRAENAAYEGGKTAAWGFGGGILGGAVAGSLASTVFPPAVPVVGILGAIAGGSAAIGVHDAAFKQDVQDPITIAMQVAKMHELDGNVDHIPIFAALAANLQGEQGKHVDRILQSYTGTKFFTEALADPNNIPKLAAMASDPIIDSYIRAQTGMTFDLKDSSKPVAVQYAELINSGKLDVSKILEPSAGMYATITPPAIPVNPLQQNAEKNTDIAMPSVPYVGQGNQHKFVG